MRSLGLVQAQRARDRFEDTLGSASQVAALHPVVVVDADSGQDRDLLAPESGDLSRSEGGEANRLGSDLRPPRREEIPYLGPGVHDNKTKPEAEDDGVPCQYLAKPVLSAFSEQCFRGAQTSLIWGRTDTGE